MYIFIIRGCIGQFHWLGFVNMYLHDKNYETVASGLNVGAILQTDYGWTRLNKAIDKEI